MDLNMEAAEMNTDHNRYFYQINYEHNDLFRGIKDRLKI